MLVNTPRGEIVGLHAFTRGGVQFAPVLREMDKVRPGKNAGLPEALLLQRAVVLFIQCIVDVLDRAALETHFPRPPFL